MHGLINRSIQCFVWHVHGPAVWGDVARRAGLDFECFEAMLQYDDSLTETVLSAASVCLKKPRSELLEDVGAYLVFNTHSEAVRRLLRFGGSTFLEFLYSLDDLHERAKLAVHDLELPDFELREHGRRIFSLTCRSRRSGFGDVMVGLLRAMADDYGALVVLHNNGGQGEHEVISIEVLEPKFARGRQFELAKGSGG